MKINLIFFLARFGKGGAGNSIYRLCKGLDKKKFDITVLCLNKCAYEKKLRNNWLVSRSNGIWSKSSRMSFNNC